MFGWGRRIEMLRGRYDWVVSIESSTSATWRFYHSRNNQLLMFLDLFSSLSVCPLYEAALGPSHEPISRPLPSHVISSKGPSFVVDGLGAIVF